jgi:hypothetical protein
MRRTLGLYAGSTLIAMGAAALTAWTMQPSGTGAFVIGMAYGSFAATLAAKHAGRRAR